MFMNWADAIDLGAIPKEEKEMLKNDLSYKKQVNELIRKGRTAAKGTSCYYCGKNTTSFCNSHSIPAFCLRNIATNGIVMTPNAMIDIPLVETEKGVNKAGTFQLICRECDSVVFAEYENPDNYKTTPTPRMIAQIALKNTLKAISKRQFDIEFNNAMLEKFGIHEDLLQSTNEVYAMDLAEYIAGYRKAKKALEKDRLYEYYVCFYERLNYVVPFAFQCAVALALDFEGNVINDIYNTSPNYEIKNIHICVFPLKNETAVIMFVENGDKRYRKFIKQFNKLSFDDKLAAITYIIFAYSEDIFFSKAIQAEVEQNGALCEASRMSTNLVSTTMDFDRIGIIRKYYDLQRRHEIPNLLNEKYKLR